MAIIETVKIIYGRCKKSCIYLIIHREYVKKYSFKDNILAIKSVAGG